MRKVLKDVWMIITYSVKDLDDPNSRILWMVGIILVAFIIVLSLTAVLTGFIQNLFEIIGNTITNTVIGEFPETLEK
jgi:hypothetical protein